MIRRRARPAVPVIKKKPKSDEGFGGAEPEPQGV